MKTRDCGFSVRAGLSMVLVLWSAVCGRGKGEPRACAASGACEIGTACGRDVDCLFGACARGTCAEPAGPLPTGPVSATIAAAGGTIDVVTAEHVTLHLDFPAGAVSAPLAVSITPIAPAAGEWARVELRPSGVLLSKPATLRLTLPAAFPAIDGATLGCSTARLSLRCRGRRGAA